MALNATFDNFGIPFGTLTIVVGHATFCVVVVYNNVIARLRRSSRRSRRRRWTSGADSWQTFRYVTFPVLRTAIVAAGLLAFALSFDEIIVTTFTAGTRKRCRSGSSITFGCRTSARSSTSSPWC